MGKSSYAERHSCFFLIKKPQNQNHKTMKLKVLGAPVSSVKRGTFGPSPARKNLLWDSKAARKKNTLVTSSHTGEAIHSRKNTLVITSRTGEVMSSVDATQEQLSAYVEARWKNLLAEGARRGHDLITKTTLPDGSIVYGNCRGRAWLARVWMHEKTVARWTRHLL